MWYTGELAYRSYLPKKLEKGMLFITIQHQGTVKESVEVWTLERSEQHMDDYLATHGAPIELHVINEDGDILAEPEEIGWFDLGESFMTLTDISLKEINIILNEYDGLVEIEIDDDSYDNEDIISPLIQHEKVTLRFLTDDVDLENNDFGDWNITLMDGIDD